MKRFATCLLLVFLSSPLRGDEPDMEVPRQEITPEQRAFFETHVRPVFVEKCFRCHGDGKHRGNLQLDSLKHALVGGDSGPAIVPGNPDESILIQAINYDGYEMPPGQKLSDNQIARITEWVAMGAPWPASDGDAVAMVRKAGTIADEDRAWWSFQPIVSPPVPELKQFPAPANPIDAFVLAALEEKGLQPNPIADARTLVRRAFFDLIGLPPSPEEMKSWTQALDSGNGVIDQGAWEKLIDDLLARPQYGERWGRHWLDVVRFAQTNGYEFDKEKTYAWRFRDYVVNSFNNDKPYDRFVIEQLAGDELPDANAETRIATGFYHLGIWDFEPDDAQQAEFDDLDDIMVTSSAAFLGLTMGCARCHDHKYDPILHKDYYSLLAFFSNIRRYNYASNEPENPALLPLNSDQEVAAVLAERSRRWAELDAQIAATEDKKAKEELQKKRNNKEVSGLEWALAVREHGANPKPTRVLIRGNSQTPGDEVPAAIPTVLGGLELKAAPPERMEPFQTSGRRLALAQWFVSPENPLTARVMANRIWHYHFGRGIVQTTSDFGKIGAPPTHPELLDWLADYFRSNGWSIKQLHRMIMTSQTYQRSSDTRNPAADVDPGNELLWRQNLRRLDAESIRDNMLAISGLLNLEMGGRGYFPQIGAEVLSGGTQPGIGWELSTEQQRNRRSLYTFIKRSLIPPQLDMFDYANTALPLTERPTTTVAPQALTLLNDSSVQKIANAFAERIARDAGEDPTARIARAFELATGRAPTASEVEISKQFIEQQQQEYAGLRSRIMFKPIVPERLNPDYLRLLGENDFLEGLSTDWTPFRGNWSNIGVVNPRQGPGALWNGAVFFDANVSATMTLGNASDLGSLLLRAEREGTFVRGYEILLDPRNSTLSIIRHEKEPQLLGQVPANIPTGIPLGLNCRIEGNHLAVQLELPDDRAVLDLVDPKPLTAPGKLGLRTWGASLILDDLQLEFGAQAIDVATAQLNPAALSPPPSTWSEYEGNWRLTGDHALRPAEPTPGAKLIFNPLEFGDGVVEADVQVRGTGDAGLVVRVTQERLGMDALNAYNINFTKSFIRLGKHEGNWRELVKVPYEIGEDRWVHLKAVFNGGRIRIYADNEPEPVIDFTDPHPLPPGKIGFRTFRCAVGFRDLAVERAGRRETIDLGTIRPMAPVQLAVSGTKPDQSEQRAWAAFCLLVLNLNETIYVE